MRPLGGHSPMSTHVFRPSTLLVVRLRFALARPFKPERPGRLRSDCTPFRWSYLSVVSPGQRGVFLMSPGGERCEGNRAAAQTVCTCDADSGWPTERAAYFPLIDLENDVRRWEPLGADERKAPGS